METKKVMATFILTSLMFIGVTTNYENKLEELQSKNEVVLEQKSKQDTEIANLRDVLKDKDNVIKDKDNAIQQVDTKLNEVLEATKEQEKVIETQKKLIDEQKRMMELQKQELKKSREQVSFKNEEKGSDVQGGRKLNATFTAYTAYCKGCSGITATGENVTDSVYYNGMRIIATDPSVIPLHSIVQVNVNGESFKAIALDKGGAIKGDKVDFLVSSYDEAVKFGRQQATVTILREGK